MCSSSGNGGAGGTVRNAKNPLRSSGASGRNSRYQLRISAARSSENRVGPPTIVCTGLSLNVNAVTTPKLPPPPRSAQNRSSCSVSLAVDEPTVGQHHVGADQVVDRQAELAGQVPQAASQREPAHAGRPDDAERRRQTERVRGVIDVADQRSSKHHGGAAIGIDSDPTHQRQVDHQPVIDAAESATVVRSAADRDFQLGLAGVAERGHHVTRVGAAGDQARPLVDHRVVQLPGFVIPGVEVADDLPAQALGQGAGGIELLVAGFCCCAHRSS